MPTNPRVDQYISAAAAFARPTLEHLSAVVHKACPEAEESRKWCRPAFLYPRENSVRDVGFKAHCTFGFWHPEMGKLLAARERWFKSDEHQAYWAALRRWSICHPSGPPRL